MGFWRLSAAQGHLRSRFLYNHQDCIWVLILMIHIHWPAASLPQTFPCDHYQACTWILFLVTHTIWPASSKNHRHCQSNIKTTPSYSSWLYAFTGQTPVSQLWPWLHPSADPNYTDSLACNQSTTDIAVQSSRLHPKPDPNYSDSVVGSHATRQTLLIYIYNHQGCIKVSILAIQIQWPASSVTGRGIDSPFPISPCFFFFFFFL